jgi:hypothetical protein
VLRSREGVLLGEWPCTFTGWHRHSGHGFAGWVYTLVDDQDRVAYVGQTGLITKRLKQHGRTKRFAWWYAFGTNDWRADETAHIERCRPYLFSDGSECRNPGNSRVIFYTDVLAGER